MNPHLTCSQVAALINYYIEGKLNPTLKKYVDAHLNTCPNCNKKFKELEDIIINYEKLKQENYKKKSDEYCDNKELIQNLSAYIDNELNSNDNIKIKKITVSNPKARQKLETMYKFQKILHYAYEKTKNDYKIDSSKDIVAAITNNKDYTTTYFKKIVILFIIILIAIISGFIYLYF